MKQYNETTRACVVYAVIGEVRKTQFSQKLGDHSNFSQQFKLSTQPLVHKTVKTIGAHPLYGRL